MGKKEGLPYGAVDMGLPSGTLWAQGNICKDAQGNYYMGEPTEYGCYFSRANIDGHNDYSEDGYLFNLDNYKLTPGYSFRYYSIPDNDTTHDAAVARLGSGWHMPTTQDFRELIDAANTTIQTLTVDGVRGFLFTSLLNGNTVFFPASGQRVDANKSNFNQLSFYWGRSITVDYAPQRLYIDGSGAYIQPAYNKGGRFGLSIRPIITI